MINKIIRFFTTDKNMQEPYITYKIYFVSGETIEIEFTKEVLKELQDKLKTNWYTTYIFGPDSGINFALVTHYTQIKKDDR